MFCMSAGGNQALGRLFTVVYYMYINYFTFNGNRFVETATPDAVRLMSCRAVYPRSWLLAIDLA